MQFDWIASNRTGARLFSSIAAPPAIAFLQEERMQLGMIGLGRMGSNMVRRLVRGGHQCVGFDKNYASVNQIEKEGAKGAASLEDFVGRLSKPRAVWMMVPAAFVDSALESLSPLLAEGDTVIDGGNSYYVDDLRRARELAAKRIYYVDVGVSGGVWGLERGYCLMIGGEPDGVERLGPIFRTLAPSRSSAPPTPNARPGTAQDGYLHCGPPGAGHFVKMVHNGIEYGVMAAYAEGLNILQHANAGSQERAAGAETAPLRNPEHYRYDLDIAAVAEVWRRGSVIASWLLDLTAAALAEQPDLEGYSGRVSDSGEGRWTLQAAVETSSPAPVLSAALFDRFSSRGEATFADRVLSAMRHEFGGHAELPASRPGSGA
jgi:6-phosphogluconate dehydrogenase